MKTIKIKFTTLEEQKQLYDFLAENGYHWLSGQVANNPPTVFANPFTVFANPFWSVKDIRCFRSLDMKNKKIGYYPFEVLSKEEKINAEKESVSVSDLITNWDSMNQEVNA